MENDTISAAPTITIYVRHSTDCKYHGDDFAKRCDCRKWLRWTQDGVRQRIKANTRSWAEAEQVRQCLANQFSGKVAPAVATGSKDIRSAMADYFPRPDL